MLTIKESTPKRTVVIPAFTRPLVGLAAARASFTVALCDVQGQGQLDYDLVQLEGCVAKSDHAAVAGVESSLICTTSFYKALAKTFVVEAALRKQPHQISSHTI